MHLRLILGLILAAAAAVLTNLAYSQEHDAAASLPALSLRRPLHSLALLLGDRGWMRGFAMEGGGFLCYAAALALAPLALVQGVGAGGIGVLAYVSAKMGRRRMRAHESAGVVISVVGLAMLGVSLLRAGGAGGQGALAGILAWIGGCAAAAAVVLAVLGRRGRLAVAQGCAGGLLFSIGDFSTKLATQGGAHLAFVVTLLAGYGLGTSLLQLGYQRGGALTVAGLATLLTNALPILAGTIVLGEGVPPGALGVLRILAFLGVCAGAVLLAAPEGGGRQGHGGGSR